ncbi:hypothetical protein K490DRAFT_62153 [Saccharata proteae CBS 121410]|uniref:Uncharacterized protein n=1 Tax=Saccharata proteae CBS 121410 TaxID=1314787 RepID=A0A9P4I2T1_9PEZI|nr:hypothetical protein K490DRAFT_62153 [Saccharata proteae CBS 121410]
MSSSIDMTSCDLAESKELSTVEDLRQSHDVDADTVIPRPRKDSCQAGSIAAAQRTLVVRQIRQHKHLLDRVDLFSAGCPKEMMDKLRKSYYEGIHPFRLFINKYFLFQRIMVGRAVLAELSCLDLEAQQWPLEVLVLNKQRSDALTAGFFRPDLMPQTYDIFDLGNGSSDSSSVCLVGLELDRSRVAYCILAGTVVAIAAGTATGIMTHSLQLGIACSTSLTCLLAVLQPVLIWLLD